jgi:hypothetical protein
VWHWDQDDFAALAADGQDPVAVFLAEVGSVGPAASEDLSPEQAEPRSSLGHNGVPFRLRRIQFIMRLRKLDYITSLLVSVSFVGGFVLAFSLVFYVVSAVVPWSHDTDAGLVLVPIPVIVAVPCAWLDSWLGLSLYGRRTRQPLMKQTFGFFAIFVFAGLAVTIAIGSISSRAFVTIPALLISLAAAYLMARLVAINKQSK